MLGAACLCLAACTPAAVLRVFDNLHLTAGQVHTAKASFPYEIQRAETSYVLPAQYSYQGRLHSTDTFLKKSGTAGLVIVHDGKIVYENYAYGKNAKSRFHAWSVSKSVVSALIGIAIDEGYIGDVSDPVIKYVPSLSATAYADSTVQDVLEMASGVRFDETYNLGTDVFRLQVAVGKDLSEEVHKYVVKDHATGTFNAYKSLDTVVLGMVLASATGQTITSYLQSRLWEPAGMTQDARWLADRNGLEGASCCLQATLRDQAKFGLIYLNDGFYDGRQIIPRQWVIDSLDTSKPHLQPGENPNSDDSWGYGYQWWIPDTGNDYAAVGVYNQFIYVNPDVNLVIAKASAPFSYLVNDREDEHIAFFRAISEHIKSKQD